MPRLHRNSRVVIFPMLMMLVVYFASKELSGCRRRLPQYFLSHVAEQETRHFRTLRQSANSSDLCERMAVLKMVSRKMTLTGDDEEEIRNCVENGPVDRKKNEVFWAKHQLRHTHHTYLKTTKEPIVIDVGGNTGQDASEYVRLYDPHLVILEPVQEYFQRLVQKFKDNPRVAVLNFGLGQHYAEVKVKVHGDDGDASSMFDKDGNTPIVIADVVDFFLHVGIGQFDVDLMSLNCEGCEYEVLETLLNTNLVKYFQNIQFATHSTLDIPAPLRRYCRIRQLLKRTHRTTYDYKFIWENWQRIDLAP